MTDLHEGLSHDVATEGVTSTDLLNMYASHCGRAVTAPVDVEGIACFLGISIREYTDTDDSTTVGKISVGKDKKVKIEINSLQNLYEPRRRFTIAHELAHYCLHFKKGSQKFIDTQSTMSRSESYWDKHESEANSFAASLLMPKDLVISVGQDLIRKYRSSNASEPVPADYFIDEMAKAFNVSTVSMKYRLEGLGVLKQ